MAVSMIAEREPEHPRSGEFLRDIVFGANDGVVTAIGFLVGFAGTVADQKLIVVAGTLGIIAGAASMALGNYLAVKSQKEYYDQMEAIERWEMEHKADTERQEIEEIYTNMGFDEQAVGVLTKKVTSNKELWLKVMMRDELGLGDEVRGNPLMSGVVIGFFYILGGIPPLLPFILVEPVARALLMSIVVSIIVMGCIGLIRWFLNKGSVRSKVVETVTIGVSAAFIGWIAGEVLRILGYSVNGVM